MKKCKWGKLLRHPGSSRNEDPSSAKFVAITPHNCSFFLLREMFVHSEMLTISPSLLPTLYFCLAIWCFLHLRLTPSSPGSGCLSWLVSISSNNGHSWAYFCGFSMSLRLSFHTGMHVHTCTVTHLFMAFLQCRIFTSNQRVSQFNRFEGTVTEDTLMLTAFSNSFLPSSLRAEANSLSKRSSVILCSTCHLCLQACRLGPIPQPGLMVLELPMTVPVLFSTNHALAYTTALDRSFHL